MSTTKVQIRVVPSRYAKLPEPVVTVSGGRGREGIADTYRIAARFVDKMGDGSWCCLPQMGHGYFTVETTNGTVGEAQRAVGIVREVAAEFGWDCEVAWETPDAIEAAPEKVRERAQGVGDDGLR